MNSVKDLWTVVDGLTNEGLVFQANANARLWINCSITDFQLKVLFHPRQL